MRFSLFCFPSELFTKGAVLLAAIKRGQIFQAHSQALTKEMKGGIMFWLCCLHSPVNVLKLKGDADELDCQAPQFFGNH